MNETQKTDETPVPAKQVHEPWCRYTQGQHDWLSCREWANDGRFPVPEQPDE